MNALGFRDSALLEATERSLVADDQAEPPLAVAGFQDDFEAGIAHLLLEERRRAVEITRHRPRGRRTIRSPSAH